MKPNHRLTKGDLRYLISLVEGQMIWDEKPELKRLNALAKKLMRQLVLLD